MTLGVLIVVAVGVAVTGLSAWAMRGGAVRAPARRTVPVPTRRIADVVEGERVRIAGFVDVDVAIEAPLTGRWCALWKVVVEEERGEDVSTIVDHGGAELVLRDPSGTARIVMNGGPIDINLAHEEHFASGFLRDAGSRLESFLAKHGRKSTALVFNRALRYRESVLYVGERAVIVGVGRWEPDPDGGISAGDGYRDAKPRKRLVIRSSSGLSLAHDGTAFR